MLVPFGQVKTDNQKIGDASSAALEAGIAYHLHDNHRFGLGLKLESQSYSFDSGTKQTHAVSGIFFSYNYLFQFK